MKAVGARRYLPVSDRDCLVEFETEMPVPGSMDLLVRVAAIAVNPVDTKIRASLGEVAKDPPRILGWDAAGIVVGMGAAVTDFAPGDEVFYAGDLTRPGSNAEFQSVDARLVARKPSSWSLAEAAAIPLVALTAWELLFERMGVAVDGRDEGKPLLIINGGGGVGSALIPLARSAGLRVIATASRPETVAWCRSLGANEVFDHRKPLAPQAAELGIAGFPYIANLHSTDAYWDVTSELIAPFGVIGLIVEPRTKLHIGDPLKAKCVRIAWEFMAARPMFQTPDMHRQGEILAEIARRCDSGRFPKLATRVIEGLTADRLRDAHIAMENHRAIGKWVITIEAETNIPTF